MHPTDQLVSLGQVRIARAARGQNQLRGNSPLLTDGNRWAVLHAAAARGDILDPADSLRNRSFGRYAEVLGSATAHLREENAASERLVQTIDGLP